MKSAQPYVPRIVVESAARAAPRTPVRTTPPTTERVKDEDLIG
jgi:hypothetical protein